MQRNKIMVIFISILCFAVFTVAINKALSEDIPRITKEELKEKLGSPNVVIVDVRVGKDWKSSEFKIKGAVRGDPKDVKSWAGKYAKEKTLVFYCA